MEGSGDMVPERGGPEPAPRKRGETDWQARFLAMLPAIRRQAEWAFRRHDADAREEAVQEVVATALVIFRRLVERQRTEAAYPSSLAGFAIRRVRSGRRVATRLNARDVSSPYCRIRTGVRVRHLGLFCREDHLWQAHLVENRFAGPAEIAATRIDFGCWLAGLPARLQSIAKILATGEGTGEAARRLGVSSGRISQLRRQLEDSWNRFTDGAASGRPTVA